MHLLFLTTVNLSSNPRLVKEIKLANKLGFAVTVVAFLLGNWSDKNDEKFRSELKDVNFHYLSATRKPFVSWLSSSLVEQVALGISSLIKENLLLNALAHNKRTLLMCTYLRKLPNKYHLIIAHNLGALFPAYFFSQKCNIPFGFDVEDYHPGELILDRKVKQEKMRRENLLQTILPKALYVSFAGKMIENRTRELLILQKLSVAFSLNNCFSELEFAKPEAAKKEEKVKFIWFSQNITAKRGLELIVPVLCTYQEKIDLTLVGNLDENFYASFLKQYSSFINIEAPKKQADLHASLRHYDVGLAVEVSIYDENKNLALSNKIIAYKQAGVFILATDTGAQKEFIERFPAEGVVVGQNQESLNEAVQYLIKNIGEIRRSAWIRYETGKNVSWEKESQKLVNTWESIKIIA